MIYPVPIITSADSVAPGDVVFDPVGRASTWWRKVSYVSHHGLSPDRRTTLHFSPNHSRDYKSTAPVIIGFEDEEEDE